MQNFSSVLLLCKMGRIGREAGRLPPGNMCGSTKVLYLSSTRQRLTARLLYPKSHCSITALVYHYLRNTTGLDNRLAMMLLSVTTPVILHSVIVPSAH